MRVGMFDSGVGGLTVLRAFLKYHPNNEYIYYGDTLNVPYGDKTVDELYLYATNIINYLISRKVDIIVIACGTISANLYEKLKKEYDIPIYSVISMLPNYMLEKDYKKTLVLATNSTINTHIYKNSIKNEIIEVGCSKLVPIIESNNYENIDKVLDEYLIDLDSIDSIILGCTHYPLISKYIRKKINRDIDLIDIGEVLARSIELDDSFQSLEYYFSKNSKVLRDNIKRIIGDCYG